MYGIRCKIFMVAQVIVLHVTKSEIAMAGKCKTQGIDILHINFDDFAGISEWKMLYVPDVSPFNLIDYATVYSTSNNDGSYTLDSTKVTKYHLSDSQTYNDRYEGDAVNEETVDFMTGKVYRFKIYPLAATEENAVLYLRCAEDGDLPVDTRFIAIPEGRKLSDEVLQHFLAVDRSYNFTGGLYKLPYNLFERDY